MSKLQAALAWAARGFRIFPLVVGGKEPLTSGWTETATTDPAVIERIWRDPVLGIERDYNIGVLTTDRVVLDIDVKGDKNGIASLFGLGLDFDTLTVRTPSGGYHLYYSGPDSSGTVNRLGDGLDIRSHNNYVVAPGSSLGNGDYRLELDLPVLHVPPAVGAQLVAPRTRSPKSTTHVDLDTPEAISHAEHYLDREAPLAIEGLGGDDTTYRVCCRLRDYGVSEDTACDLLVSRWNERCSPPWPVEELCGKIANAFAYATGDAGSRHPAVTFGDVDLPPIPALTIDIIKEGLFVFGNAKAMSTIAPRPWIVKNLLLSRNITAMVATGAAGKSTLALLIAAHLAVAKDFAGMRVLRPGKSVIYNAEDDVEEMSRRLWAICVEYQLDFDAVRAGIMLVDQDMLPLQITEGSPPKIHGDHVQRLIEWCSDPEVVMLALDPLVNLHSVPEDDNVQMGYVMQSIRFIARQSDVAVFLAHHTRKPGSMSSVMAGDASSSRGATAVINAARVALTLVNASAADAARYSIPEADMPYYVRLDGAKANFSLADKPVWFRRKGVTAMNGDDVGTLTVADLEQSAAGRAQAVAILLADHLENTGQASITINDAAVTLRTLDNFYAKMEDRLVKAELNALLGRPVRTPDNREIVRKIEGSKTLIVLT